MFSTLLKHGIVIIIQVITFCVVLAANQISAKPALYTKHKVYCTLQAIYTVCCRLYAAQHYILLHNTSQYILQNVVCLVHIALHKAVCMLHSVHQKKA